MSIVDGVAVLPAMLGTSPCGGSGVDREPTNEDLGEEEREFRPSARSAYPRSRFHRIAEVRRQQGVSMRTIARHTGIEARTLKQEELESSDLRLSDLYRWQEALGVPIADLLVEPSSSLAPEIQQRAQLVKVMKTVAALMESAESTSVRRLAETLRGQLIEIMPELDGVSPWPAVGQRRSLDDYGRAAERRFTAPQRNEW